MVRFLKADPTTPLRIPQSRRWGTVDFADDEPAVITPCHLGFDGDRLHLGDPVNVTARPARGATVAAHWDWVCGTLDENHVDDLAGATASTMDLVNRLRAR